MSAPKRRKATAPKLALRIARAQLRAVRGFALRPVVPAGLPIVQAQPGPAQFIQCWAVGRGYSGITQALDSAGQVWERVSLMGESQQDGVKRKFLKESWWEPLSMERRVPSTRKDETE